jgi:hypothetical protein
MLYVSTFFFYIYISVVLSVCVVYLDLCYVLNVRCKLCICDLLWKSQQTIILLVDFRLLRNCVFLFFPLLDKVAVNEDVCVIGVVIGCNRS